MERKTINQWMNEALSRLEKREYNHPELEVKLLMEEVLNCDRIFLIMNGNDELDEELGSSFMDLVEIRMTGKPIQYILGHQEFMGLDLQLNDQVLVPRGDTEILVEYIIEWAKNLKKDINILDIGTGSGAIALSLAHFLPEAKVWTVDINTDALDIARKNAKLLEVSNRVTCVESDLFNSLNKEVFDIIVSNPPYIPSRVIDTLQEEVRFYEPRNALDGGEDGLDFYKMITKEAPNWMNDGGLLAYEIGHDQGIAVSKLMESRFTNIEIKKDYAGKDRVVVGEFFLTKTSESDSIFN